MGCGVLVDDRGVLIVSSFKNKFHANDSLGLYKFFHYLFFMDKPIGASLRRWLDSSCCLGLLGLLCCDHDDRVFPYTTATGIQCLFM